jgi:hypothetical protein
VLEATGDAGENNLWVLTIECHQGRIEEFEEMCVSLLGEKHLQKQPNFWMQQHRVLVNWCEWQCFGYYV